eukprot:m.185404 g.185404  ORF g.185404 m.185404 type:complete len:998 (+) comp18116_c0_seq7:2010-5003(+)
MAENMAAVGPPRLFVPGLMAVLAVLAMLPTADGDGKRGLSADSVRAAAMRDVPASACAGPPWHWTSRTDTAEACALKLVSDKADNADAWVILGDVMQQRGGDHEAASFFKEARRLAGPLCTKHVHAWWFLGPLPVGKLEFDGDPAWESGGPRHVGLGDKVPSELASSQYVKWSLLPRSADGSVHLNPSNVDWGDLVRSLGSMGITEWQGWVRGDFSVTEERDVHVQCSGLRSVYVDNTLLAQDVYARPQFWTTVRLKPGVHTLWAHIRARGQAAFRCSLDTAIGTGGDPWIVLPPESVPDLLEGFFVSNKFALKITNLSPTNWIQAVKVSVTGRQFPMDQTTYDIAPGQTHMLVTQVSLAPTLTGEGTLRSLPCPGNIEFRVTAAGFRTVKLPVTLRCRKRFGQSFAFTFIDHDGSVQTAAAIPPRRRCENSLCPVLVSLHGTGVPPLNQAESYKFMKNDEWNFGLDTAWVLAPSRHGAHNWEGPGRLTALAALRDLLRLSSVHVFCEDDSCPYRADSSRLIIAGHSMGGHGAWHLASLVPDAVMALIPAAGWISKEDYGDTNLFMRHDVAASFISPALKAILEACVAENAPDRLASHFKGIPILARVGQNDRTVHPYNQRRMRRALIASGVDTMKAVEIKGKEHWWWDTHETNDGGAVFDNDVREFLTSHDQMPPCPTSFTLTVHNPASFGGRGGITIAQAIVPHALPATVHVNLDTETGLAVLNTSNAKILRFTKPHFSNWNWAWKDLIIDDNHLKTDGTIESAAAIYFCRGCDNGECAWKSCDTPNKHEQRVLLQHGPMRRVFEAPFVIVAGASVEAEAHFNIEMAVFIANQFLLTSDAAAPVLNDTDVDADSLERHNLLLIGTPESNSIIRRLLASTEVALPPFTLAAGHMQLASCRFSEARTGAMFLLPLANGGLAAIITGNSAEGMEDVVSMAIPTVPPMARSPFSNMIPDFVVTGPQTRAKGPGGWLCAGFWGNTWQFEQAAAAPCVCSP